MDPQQQSDAFENRPTCLNQGRSLHQGPVNDFGIVQGFMINRLLSQDSNSWTYEGFDREVENRRVPPDVREDAARSYLRWLYNRFHELLDHQGELLASLLETAVHDEPCRRGFRVLNEFQFRQGLASTFMCSTLSYQLKGEYCSNEGRAMAAFALRYFKDPFGYIRERLERYAGDGENFPMHETVRMAASESLQLLLEQTKS